jgi:zinc protease
MSMARFDRTIPPSTASPSKVAFPPFAYKRLQSGVPVYVVESHLQPLVSVALYARSSSSTDVPGKEGRASITMEMLTKGTTSRSAPEIADTIDALGGSLGSHAGWDASTVSVTVLSKFLPQVLDLVADIIHNPRFEDEELARIKIQRQAALVHGKSDPNHLADTLFTKLAYAPHSYGLETTGTERSLDAMQSEELRRYHQRIFRADELFFIVAGDITPEEITAQLDARFSTWSSAPSQVTESHVSPVMQTKVRVALVEKPQAVQSALRVGHLAIQRAHPDYVACYGMNMILGGYFNSRINQNLRERNGFTYGARSYFDARKQTGSFVVSTEIRTEVTVQTVREILAEIERMRSDLVTTDELTTMKNYIIGSFPMTIETPQQVGARLAILPLYGFTADYYDQFRDQVAALTVGDIQRAAQTYLAPGRITIVASGDVNALAEPMSEFATIEYFDQDFEPITR